MDVISISSTRRSWCIFYLLLSHFWSSRMQIYEHSCLRWIEGDSLISCPLERLNELLLSFSLLGCIRRWKICTINERNWISMELWIYIFIGIICLNWWFSRKGKSSHWFLFYRIQQHRSRFLCQLVEGYIFYLYLFFNSCLQFLVILYRRWRGCIVTWGRFQWGWLGNVR
jgi:hypothetical protein